MDKLFDSVVAINELLAEQGAFIVQKVLLPGNRILYGYSPQAVFDAVNVVLKPENWHYTISEMVVYEAEVVARVRVKIGETECEQFGGMKIIKGDRGSAHKGAVTDALQKAFSMFGIGNLAYRGELKAVYESGGGANTEDQSQPGLSILKSEAEGITGRANAEAWWKKNLSEIQALTQPEIEVIVKILGTK